VEPRKAGTSVYYSVRDPQVFQLLDVARQIFNNHLIDLQTMLSEEDRIPPRSPDFAATSPQPQEVSPARPT
jgi:hypothetical protein